LSGRVKITVLFSAGIILLLALAEILCAAALRYQQHAWIYKKPPNYNYMLFEPDTRLTGVPRKNISLDVNGIQYTHNSQGFRGADFLKLKTKKRIACIGGSTTYCVGVSDNQTWEFYLDSLLADYEVLNFGIPGHNTVEHKKLLADVLKNYSPDIIILQLGLNDLRCMNVDSLADDYGNFHQPTLYGSFGFCRQERLPHSGLLTAGWIALRKMKLVACCPFHAARFSGTVSDSVDGRVLEIFSNNLNTMLRQCADHKIPVILLPQTLSQDVLDETNYKWWVPYLTKKGIFTALDTLSSIMKKKADGERTMYFDIREDWAQNEFADQSHLNGTGNKKLAEAVEASLNLRSFSNDSSTITGRFYWNLDFLGDISTFYGMEDTVVKLATDWFENKVPAIPGTEHVMDDYNYLKKENLLFTPCKFLDVDSGGIRVFFHQQDYDLIQAQDWFTENKMHQRFLYISFKGRKVKEGSYFCEKIISLVFRRM